MVSFSSSHWAIKPSQIVAVAERRFDDAKALSDTGQNARANGAQYLAGIAIDILLKAKLALLYPVVARKRPHEVSSADRAVWNLIWRHMTCPTCLTRCQV